MIINGHSRGNAKHFAGYLTSVGSNEQVEVKELRGFTSDNVRDAFKELEIIGGATRTKNYFYHAHINPRVGEALTPEQWTTTIDALEKQLGFEGQERMVIEHQKIGKDGELRTHQHVIWNRINADTMTAIPDNWNYLAHIKTQEELAELFQQQPTPMPLTPDRTRIRDWESYRGQASGISPAEMKAEITQLFTSSDSGVAFASALEDSGYVLCRGDKQGVLCIIDSAGDSHALLRRIDGIRAADLRGFMADIDPQALPSVAEAVALVKALPESESGDSAARVLPQEQQAQGNPKIAVLEHYAQGHATGIDPREAPFVRFFPDLIAPAATIYERGDQLEAQLRQKAARMTPDDWLREDEANERAWNATFRSSGEEARNAEAWKEWQAYEAQYNQARPVPSLEELATQGVPASDPATIDRSKQPDESWLEFVTREKPPDKQPHQDKTDETEPELER